MEDTQQSDKRCLYLFSTFPILWKVLLKKAITFMCKVEGLVVYNVPTWTPVELTISITKLSNLEFIPYVNVIYVKQWIYKFPSYTVYQLLYLRGLRIYQSMFSETPASGFKIFSGYKFYMMCFFKCSFLWTILYFKIILLKKLILW